MIDGGADNGEKPGSGAPGDAPPDLSDPQVAWQLVAQETHAKLAGLVAMFASNFPPERLPQVVEFVVREQQMYQSHVMRSILDPKAILAAPRMAIAIQPMKDSKTPGGPEFVFACHKQPQMARADQVFSWAVLMLFILNPGLRGLLRIFGYNYELREIKDSPIITLGRR